MPLSSTSICFLRYREHIAEREPRSRRQQQPTDREGRAISANRRTPTTAAEINGRRPVSPILRDGAVSFLGPQGMNDRVSSKDADVRHVAGLELGLNYLKGKYPARPTANFNTNADNAFSTIEHRFVIFELPPDKINKHSSWARSHICRF